MNGKWTADRWFFVMNHSHSNRKTEKKCCSKLEVEVTNTYCIRSSASSTSSGRTVTVSAASGRSGTAAFMLTTIWLFHLPKCLTISVIPHPGISCLRRWKFDTWTVYLFIKVSLRWTRPALLSGLTMRITIVRALSRTPYSQVLNLHSPHVLVVRMYRVCACVCGSHGAVSYTTWLHGN